MEPPIARRRLRLETLNNLGQIAGEIRVTVIPGAAQLNQRIQIIDAQVGELFPHVEVFVNEAATLKYDAQKVNVQVIKLENKVQILQRMQARITAQILYKIELNGKTLELQQSSNGLQIAVGIGGAVVCLVLVPTAPILAPGFLAGFMRTVYNGICPKKTSSRFSQFCQDLVVGFASSVATAGLTHVITIPLLQQFTNKLMCRTMAHLAADGVVNITEKAVNRNAKKITVENVGSRALTHLIGKAAGRAFLNLIDKPVGKLAILHASVKGAIKSLGRNLFNNAVNDKELHKDLAINVCMDGILDAVEEGAYVYKERNIEIKPKRPDPSLKPRTPFLGELTQQKHNVVLRDDQPLQEIPLPRRVELKRAARNIQPVLAVIALPVLVQIPILVQPEEVPWQRPIPPTPPINQIPPVRNLVREKAIRTLDKLQRKFESSGSGKRGKTGRHDRVAISTLIKAQEEYINSLK